MNKTIGVKETRLALKVKAAELMYDHPEFTSGLEMLIICETEDGQFEGSIYEDEASIMYATGCAMQNNMPLRVYSWSEDTEWTMHQAWNGVSTGDNKT